jgi:gas vesicle protein
MNSDSNGSGFVMGMIRGAAVGAAVGLLLACGCGAAHQIETTGRLRKSAATGYQSAVDTVGDVVTTSSGKVAQRGQETYENVKKSAAMARTMWPRPRPTACNRLPFELSWSRRGRSDALLGATAYGEARDVPANPSSRCHDRAVDTSARGAGHFHDEVPLSVELKQWVASELDGGDGAVSGGDPSAGPVAMPGG